MDEITHTSNWTGHALKYTEEQLVNTKLFKEYPEGLLLIAFVCCVLYMLIGIPGNFITIIALARCEKIHNATTAFIMNLVCSDMLFCCFNLPMVSATYWQRSWPYSTTLCRLFPLAEYGLVAVSLLSILAIMVNRYVLIAYPTLYPKIYRARYIAVKIVSIWLLSFGILTPTWFDKWGRFGMDFNIGSCSILPDRNNRSPKKFLFVAAFLIPCLLILVCYIRIFCIVRKSTKRCFATSNQRKPRRKPEASTVVSVTSTSPSKGSQDPEIEIGCVACTQKNLLDLSPPTLQPELFSFKDVSLDGHDKNCRSNAIDRNQFIIYIFKRLRQLFAALKRNQQPSKGTQPSSKDKRLLQMTVTIVVCFWLCYLPITFIKLFWEFSVPPVPRVLGYLLVYLTTCINPVIYVVMSSDYRQAYKSLFVTNDSRSTNPKNVIRSRMPIRSSRRSYTVTAV